MCQIKCGTRLRSAQKQQKLNGKGKSKLTLDLIKKLSTHYFLAIRSNVDIVDRMKNAIMETCYHICSMEEKPQHEDCPVDEDS